MVKLRLPSKNDGSNQEAIVLENNAKPIGRFNPSAHKSPADCAKRL